MAIDPVFDAVRSALAYERLRMDAASRNIAASNVPVAPGQSASAWRVDGATDGFGQMFVGDASLSEQPGDTREVYDPGHPLADKNGHVRYPATDMVQQMTTLMTASRAYEANVRSFNLLRGMMLRALEIGAK